MELFKWNVKSNRPLEIVALGDIHLGSPECDIQLLKKYCSKNKETKSKSYINGRFN